MVCSHLLMEKIGKWTLAVLDMVRINTQTVFIIMILATPTALILAGIW